MKKILLASCLLLSFHGMAAEYFVSALSGSGDGSAAKPFATIAAALKAAKSGDVITVREGIYRESLTVVTDGVTIRAAKGEYVLVSGCKVLDSKVEQTEINRKKAWRVKFSDKVWDAFADGEMMQWARFPDKTEQMNCNKDWMFTRVTDPKHIALTEMVPDNIADYQDGFYVGNHTGDERYNKVGFAYWSTFTIPITGNDGKSLIVEPKMASSTYWNSKYGRDNGLGFIIGARAALDAPGEWWCGDGYFYLIPPAGAVPGNTKLEVRTELYVMTVEAKGVTLENLNFKAGNMWLKGDNTVVRGCTFRYITPFNYNPAASGRASEQTVEGQWGVPETCTTGVYVQSNGNLIEDCYFGKSWTGGIVLWGDGNTVKNSLIEDVNWACRRNCGINAWGDRNIITFCTIQNTGSTAVEGGNANWIKRYATNNIWEHNLIRDAARLCVDQGFFYINTQNGSNPPSNTVVRYNIGINCKGPDKGKWSDTNVGLYTDNNTSGMVVHNNIIVNVKEGYRYNDFNDGKTAGSKVNIYNNTFYNCSVSNFVHGVNTNAGADIYLSNNIAFGNDDPFIKEVGKKKLKEKTPGENNFEDWPDSYLVDAKNLNFALKGKALKNKGVAVRVYHPELDPEAASIDYVGAVDPKKGMFRAGATNTPTANNRKDLALMK